MNALASAAAVPLHRIRQRELARLRSSTQVYLDHTGAPLYPQTLLHEHYRTLRDQVFGNPHSTHPASVSSTHQAEAARMALLDFLDADASEYDVIWTANASAALRLVGESFAFSAHTPFLLTVDNHNTVNGIRELARARGARVTYLPLDDALRVAPFALQPVAAGLFAYPAQSNFSGVQCPLEWVTHAQACGYAVLLDAAAYVPTNALSLRRIKPDFVALSIYKICGYPTGVGALVARHEALRTLVRPTFAGGTVEFVSVLADRYQLLSGAHGFEDGTGNYLGWSAVPAGLQWIRRLGLDHIQAHVRGLTERLLRGLLALHHRNGVPGVRIHGPTDTRARGGTVAFNVQDPERRVIDHEVVVADAGQNGICLRGGCFCNPGAAERAFRYQPDALARAFDAVGPDFSFPALRHALNDRPVGAVRASLGYGSDATDVDVLLEYLATFLKSIDPR